VNVVIAIFGLALLVFVHELGHFSVARVVGMRPRRFYIGFPFPPLVKTTRNGTEYGIGAIPFGGMVKIPGMHRPAPSDLDLQFGKALAEDTGLLAPLERAKRSLATFDLEQARASLAELEAATADAELSLQAAKSAERGLTELRDGLADDAYWRAPTSKRVAVILAGPGANVLFALIVFAILFMVGGGKATTTIHDVLPGKPAARAGLKPGDRVIAIDGTPVQASEIPSRISGSNGRALVLTVLRGADTVQIGPVRPEKIQGAYRLGFVLSGRGLSAPEAVWSSTRLVGQVSKEIATSLGRLVHKKDRKNIQSAVGIVQSSSTALSQGLVNFLWMLGLISLSLALLNLLPLLPLDGGHIAFSIVEGIRGRPLAREVYERVSMVGIALVMVLVFIGLSNDVTRIGGG
jgi:regulator of sigma E protease